MTALLAPSTELRTLADLLDQLGGISPARVLLHPAPGTATEADVIALDDHEDRLCELINGVLVEKPMGWRESLIAGLILTALNNFVHPRKLGVVSGEAGMYRLFPGLVRIPDVAYVSRERFPGGQLPREPIPSLVPDLAIEVLSESNTKAEMRGKRREYFDAGVRLVWVVDPDSHTVEVYTSPEAPQTLTEGQSLDGGEVLPAFTLEVRAIFAVFE